MQFKDIVFALAAAGSVAALPAPDVEAHEAPVRRAEQAEQAKQFINPQLNSLFSQQNNQPCDPINFPQGCDPQELAAFYSQYNQYGGGGFKRDLDDLERRAEQAEQGKQAKQIFGINDDDDGQFGNGQTSGLGLNFNFRANSRGNNDPFQSLYGQNNNPYLQNQLYNQGRPPYLQNQYPRFGLNNFNNRPSFLGQQYPQQQFPQFLQNNGNQGNPLARLFSGGGGNPQFGNNGFGF